MCAVSFNIKTCLNWFGRNQNRVSFGIKLCLDYGNAGLWQPASFQIQLKLTELNCTIEQTLILQSTNLRTEIILVLRNVKHHLQMLLRGFAVCSSVLQCVAGSWNLVALMCRSASVCCCVSQQVKTATINPGPPPECSSWELVCANVCHTCDTERKT